METGPTAKKLSALYGLFHEASRQIALSFDQSFFVFAFLISSAIIFSFFYGLGIMPDSVAGVNGANQKESAGVEESVPPQPQRARTAGGGTTQEADRRENGNPANTPPTDKTPPRPTASPSASTANSNLRLAAGRPSTASSQANYRAQIIIPAIGVDSIIVMPPSADFAVLNKSLTKGVVHYPGSALPEENGNTFLFGHSSGNLAVRTRAYAVFNRLAELRNGDIIRLQYGASEYWYRVTSLTVKKADQALVDLASTKRMVTLSTCNLFGARDDRYVVEAEFMNSYRLQSISAAASSS